MPIINLPMPKHRRSLLPNLYTADDIYDADGSLVFAAGELVATSPETNADGYTYFTCDIPIRGEQYGSSTHKVAATNSGKYIVKEIRAPLGYYVKAYHGKITKRCYFLLREDFLLFSRYQRQTKFLWENHIETMDDLLAYKENAETQIQQLARQRKVLYRQKREPERAAREEKIKSLTQQMKALRHEVYICSDIETDAAEVQEKLRQAELAAQERNEVKEDEQRRRSCRPDGAGSLTGYRSGH